MDKIGKNRLLMIVVAIIAVILFIWIVYPLFVNTSGSRRGQTMPQEHHLEEHHMEMPHTVEKFNPGEQAPHVVPEASNAKQVEEHAIPIASAIGDNAVKPSMGSIGNGPYANPQVGSVMDGPGFERCNVDGAEAITSSSIPANYYYIDDGAGGEMSIVNNLCSKSCCADQWPTPFKQKYDPYVCANKDQFVPSTLFCNNSYSDSGCLCLTKKQAEFIYNRGQNGREWF